jgi:hypothetical protein
MLNRRDVAPILCYGLLFAAVVLWAALWPANPNLSPNFSARAPVGAAQVDLADDQPEIRRLAKHMRIP